MLNRETSGRPLIRLGWRLIIFQSEINNRASPNKRAGERGREISIVRLTNSVVRLRVSPFFVDSRYIPRPLSRNMMEYSAFPERPITLTKFSRYYISRDFVRTSSALDLTSSLLYSLRSREKSTDRWLPLADDPSISSISNARAAINDMDRPKRGTPISRQSSYARGLMEMLSGFTRPPCELT